MPRQTQEAIYPLTLSPRAVWVRNWLMEYVEAIDASEIIAKAMRIHLSLLRAHEKKKTLLYQKNGHKPFPLPLLNPISQINLPDEADRETEETFRVSFAGRSLQALERLQLISAIQDVSRLVENALSVFYEIVSRTFQSQIFFVRDGNTSWLEKIEICSFM